MAQSKMQCVFPCLWLHLPNSKTQYCFVLTRDKSSYRWVKQIWKFLGMLKAAAYIPHIKAQKRVEEGKS